MDFTFTDIQVEIIKAFSVACNEGDVIVLPIWNKETGDIHPCLAVELPDDVIIPIGILFTPHQDDLSKYKFPDGLEDVDSVEGVNFVYNENDGNDDEEDEPVQLGWLDKLRGWWAK